MNATQTTYSDEHYTRLARRLYEEAINTGRLELLADMLAEDFIGPRGERGPQAVAQSIAPLRAGFPDLFFHVDDVFCSGNENNRRVTVRWTMRATHEGAFSGLPPSGNPVVQSAITIYACANGKFTRQWLMNDRLALLYQIGGLPSVPAPVEKLLRAQLEAAL
jgi:steroid delta-isomerase-like uncharacterized protein